MTQRFNLHIEPDGWQNNPDLTPYERMLLEEAVNTHSEHPPSDAVYDVAIKAFHRGAIQSYGIHCERDEEE